MNTFSPGTILVLVGTKRGLFLLTSRDRKTWEVEATTLKGHPIYYATLDQRSGHRLFAADNGDFFGTFLRYSDDFGSTWHEPEQGIQFPEDSQQKLKNIWVIEPGRDNEPGTVYVGVDPANLWVSTDGGIHWELNAGLAKHPTRERWEPGAGGLCLHTIIADPTNASRMWVGISAVGCMRTDDGGQSWIFANKNTRASFLPEKYPEFGQCIHRLVQHPAQPDVLYQQNHCGIYKSINAGNDWIDIQRDLPSEFGFPIALDIHNPDTVYVIVEDPDGRNNVSEQFTVYRTENGGERWEPLTEGLPVGPGVRLGVLRHAMCTDGLDPCGVFVGTNTGQLFASNNRGDSWHLIADFLPSIYSVKATMVV
ncbi:MAG TPA: sialidase family protein [Ktedonobacteraceae bacterium]|nr:sialidase family protein [Ktedonobacteraceae bacterium]